MAYFAVFYRLRTDPELNLTQYVQVDNKNAILPLNGRASLDKQKWEAVKHGIRFGYPGYRIARGGKRNPFFITAAIQVVDIDEYNKRIDDELKQHVARFNKKL